MGIKLAVVVLPGGDSILILGSTTLREKRSVEEVIDGLKEKVLGLNEVKKNDQTTIPRGNTTHNISVRRVSVSRY